MFNLLDDSIIYVGCPAFYKTGGTELAHQLVHELRQQGADSRILYYNYKQVQKGINPAFKIYVDSFETTESVIDSEKNVVIQPEVFPQYLEQFKSVQKAVWWMSVDNFKKNDGFSNHRKVFGLKTAVMNLIRHNITFGEFNFPSNWTHFYQSEYAKQYLIEKGIDEKRIYPLSDYINQSFFEKKEEECKKENNVLYNPKKGFEFTQKLIERSKELNWIPIQNMTTEEVVQLLCKSKVYVDFGSHPGKDRFPREAAVSGCCIITGKRGSAGFYEDVAISDEFKFDDKAENIDAIVAKISECIDNYDIECQKFSDYRAKIEGEHLQFEQDVQNILQK